MPATSRLGCGIFCHDCLEVRHCLLLLTSVQIQTSSHQIYVWIVLIYIYTIIIISHGTFSITREFLAPSSGIVAVGLCRIPVNELCDVCNGFGVSSGRSVDLASSCIVVCTITILTHTYHLIDISQGKIRHSHLTVTLSSLLEEICIQSIFTDEFAQDGHDLRIHMRLLIYSSQNRLPEPVVRLRRNLLLEQCH